MTATGTARAAVRATVRSVEAAAPVDALLARDDVYRIGPAHAAALRIELMRASVSAHRAGNPHYDAYCRRRGFEEHRLASEGDLADVPLLPSAVFKRDAALVSTAVTGPVLATISSGTQGTVSTVPRCDVTLMRFFASVAAGNRELLGHERLDRRVLHVGPTTADAPDLWIAYVMAGVGVIMPSRSYLNGSAVDLPRLVADLRRGATGSGVTLIGPPPLLVDLADHLDAHGALRLGAACQVVSIGGWKRRQGESIDRPTFRERMVAALGLHGPGQVRDTYNMVELNSVLFECAHHALHVPPWVHVSARDPRTLRLLPDGHVGLLAFLDPTPISYPGFVLSDDFGTLTRAVPCACGLTGDVVAVRRRLSRVESRGCALKLDTLTAGQTGRPAPEESR